MPVPSDQGDSAGLGGAIRALRRGRRLSQEELAERSGLSVRSISKLESGRVSRPHRHSLVRIADGLDLSADEFDSILARRGPAGPPPGPAGSGPATLLRCGLPSPGRIVLERPDLYRSLDCAAASDSNLVVLEGIGGIGKTTLALSWAARSVARYPDGQVLIDLQSYSRADPLSVDMIASELLDALDIPAAHQPRSPQARVTAVRRHLSAGRFLIILDNAASAESLRPFVGSSGGTLILATTRRRMQGIEVHPGGVRVAMPVLSDEQSAQLMAEVSGAQRPFEREELAELNRFCAGLPLAVVLTALRLRMPGVSAGDLIQEMATRSQRLPALNADPGDPTIHPQAVLETSADQLTPGARSLLVRLGTQLLPWFDLALARLLVDTDAAAAALAAQDLVSHHLARPDRTGFVVHELVLAHAAGLATALDRDEVLATRARLADHYLRAAVACANLRTPHRSARRPVMAQPDVAVGGPAEATAWLSATLPALLAIAELAVVQDGAPLRGIAVTLSGVLWDFLDEHGLFADAERLHRNAVNDAELLGDDAASVEALSNLAITADRRGDVDRADQLFAAAWTAARRLGQIPQLRRTTHNRALMDIRFGRYDAAIVRVREAIALDGTNDAALRSGYLLTLGRALEGAGRLDEADRALSAGLRDARAAGVDANQARLLCRRSVVRLRLADTARARHDGEASLALAHALSLPSVICSAENTIGDIDRAEARPAEAGVRYRRAYELATRTGETEDQARALEGLALSLVELGQGPDAIDHLHRSAGLWQSIDPSAYVRVRARIERLRDPRTSA